MTDIEDVPAVVYHLALRDEWAEAVASPDGQYRRSTLGQSLDEVGFVHCSKPHQAPIIADLVYRGRDDVVLLTVDTSKVPSSIVVENFDGGAETFPHIYGPLPVAAVVREQPVPLAADGSLDVAPLVGPA
jgi:uncharacterized protein (DUF952 family)